MEKPLWRTLSKGRCFVYVLPCREQDTLKIGYARDPWSRMRSFHPRFHEIFDLARGALIETERVSEAREIEKHLKLEFASANDAAPLQVSERAGGKFEWFRGVHPALMAELQSLSLELGYPLHAPLSDWLRDQWVEQIERLIDWSHYEFEQIETWHFNADRALVAPRLRAFRNLLDAWEGIGVRIEERLAENVRHWYRYGFSA